MRCPKCNVLTFESGPPYLHRCEPAWLVWCPERGELLADAGRIFAYDAQRAAEEWAERDDRHSADYTIVGGSPAMVHVVPDFDGEHRPPLVPEVYIVNGESVPSYYAARVAGNEP